MKKIIYTVLSLSILSSCTKDFLDKAPISNISTNNFYKTADDMKTAVSGAYAALKLNGQYKYYYTYGELSTDNIINTGGVQDQKDFGVFNLQPANSYIAAAWADNYTGIYRCNIILEKIGAINMDANLKARYIGEVKFLRALMYFNLVRYFGDVPLVLTEITSPNQGYEYSRSPVKEVYAQIIKDLNDAENVLPTTYGASDVGRATSGAAKAILGKVYLTQRNFPAAANKLKEVIDLNVYSLPTNYSNIFQAGTENVGEMIFSVQYKSGLSDQGSPFSNYYAPPGSGTYISISAPLGNVLVNDDLFNAYETGDLRKNLSISKTYIGAGGNTVTLPFGYFKKFPNPSANQYDSENNWIVIRYADVLLMYAEALNEVGYQASGAAFTYLNMVHAGARTGLNSLNATNLPDQNSFRLAIEQERRVELAGEGHRWFDLLRTNRALTVLNAKASQLNIAGNDGSGKIDAHNLLFPVPQDQVRISNNKITQNPGYPN